jgi:hypothetical protein
MHSPKTCLQVALGLAPALLFGGIGDPPTGLIPQVRETEREIYILSDVDNESKANDFIIVEKETGSAYLYGTAKPKGTYTTLSLSNPFYCGVSPISSAVILNDQTLGDILVTTSPEQNLITLTQDLAEANNGQTVSSLVQSRYPLPTDIVPVAPANGGSSQGREDAIVMSSSIPDSASVINFATLPPQNFILETDFSTVNARWLQPIQMNGATDRFLCVGTNANGNNFFILAQATGAQEKDNLTALATFSASHTLTGYTFYPATVPDEEFFLFGHDYGRTQINIYRADSSSIIFIDTLIMDAPVAFTQALQSPDGYRLFVAYTNGKADVLRYDDTSSETLYSMDIPQSSSWLGVLPNTDGSFYALHGADGMAADFELVGYAGTNTYYSAGSGKITRPSIQASFRDTVQAVAYDQEPFVGDAAPIETYKHADWSTNGSTNAFSNLSVTSWAYKDSADGLYYPGAKSVGTLPADTILAINQHQPDIAFWFGGGRLGAQGPVVTLDPVSTSGLTEAFQPVLSVLPKGTIFYRIGQVGEFTAASNGIPVITTDSFIEAYAINNGLMGPISRATYSFDKAASTRDSDGDGLPDALETDIGSNPLDADSDGDGSNDLADLLSGGIAAVMDDAATASSSAKQLAAGGYTNVSVTAFGQAAYPSRETVIADAADPASGFESVVQAFNATDNSGSRSNAPLEGTAGRVYIKDATGGNLGSASLRATSVDLEEIAIANPNHFLTTSTESFSIVPETRTWHSTFDASNEGWQMMASGVLKAVDRALPNGSGTDYAAFTTKANSDSRTLVYDVSQSPAQWKGNYSEIPPTLDGPSADIRKAAQVRAIICEVYSLDATKDGYIHWVLSDGDSFFVSEGQFLPKFDKSKIDANHPEALWTNFLFELNESSFVLGYDADKDNNSKTTIAFADVLSTVDEVAIVLSDNGRPDSILQADKYVGSKIHSGFAVDNIRALGMPSGGYPMVAVRPIPEIGDRLPAYERDVSTTVTNAVSQWLSTFTAASSLSPLTAEVSVESTIVTILLEQVLNDAIQQQDATNNPNDKQLGILHDAFGSPEDIERFSSEDLDFIRYPSRTVALPTVDFAWDLQELIAALSTKVAKNRTDGGSLHAVAHAFYRIASTFTGIAPETYDQPLVALYDLLNSNALDSKWTNALTTIGLGSEHLKNAVGEAHSIVSGTLSGTTRDMEANLRLTISENATRFTDSFDNSWLLLDRDGDAFLFPEQFAFPDASVIQVTGYSLPDDPTHKRIEVSKITLVSLPRTTPQDTDGNLMDDRWELLFFGAVGIDPYADPDSDGYNNLSEFINGTDPKVQPQVDKGDEAPVPPAPVNWPTPLRIERQSNGDFWVILPMSQSQAGQFKWTVEISDDLQSFSSNSSIVESNGSTEQVFVIPAESFSKAFFRLKAELK